MCSAQHEPLAHLRLDRMSRGLLGVLPSPLWGGVGGGGPSADHRTTPTPALRADPPHKGEGRTEFAAPADSPTRASHPQPPACHPPPLPPPPPPRPRHP